MRRIVPLALVASVALAIALSGGTGAAQESGDVPSANLEELDPVNINEASVTELLEIPGMDPGLARAIVAFRLEAGPLDSVEALYRSASITASRLLEVRPWLTAEPPGRATTFDLSQTVRSATTPPSPRLETKLSAGRGGVFVAARTRRLLSAADGAVRSVVTGLLRVRPGRGLTLSLGDLAPVEGLGLLMGVSSRPPTRGALAPHGALSSGPWGARPDGDLRRTPPAPDGRFLRGAAAAVGSHIVLGAFEYHAGITAYREEETVTPPARVLLGGFQFGPAGKEALESGDRGASGAGAPSSRGLAARTIFYDGRFWLGTTAAVPLPGSRVTLETVLDPARRHRVGLAVESAGSTRLQFRFSHVAGPRAFVNPLGADCERAPASGEFLETARNENRSETALFARARAFRRVAFELEVRSALDPATARRGWDRPVGTGIARLEASPGKGWALTAETRMENRGAPGPSGDADAPLRRHSARLAAGWDRGRAHLRVEWQGRIDFQVPPGGTATAPLDQVQDLVSARARWPLSRTIWIGGGVAHYRLPPASPGVVYEERPTGLSPAVFVRGTERRIHLAAALRLKRVEAGAFVARRQSGVETNDLTWGGVLRLRTGER
jgi:hypothetical protein